MKVVFNPFTATFDYVSVEDLSGYVPYTGATDNVDLGAHSLTANTLYPQNYFQSSTQTSRVLMRIENKDYLHQSYVEIEAEGGYGTGLTYSGSQMIGRIRFLKDNIWTRDGRSRDGHIVFSTINSDEIVEKVSILKDGTLEGEQINGEKITGSSEVLAGSYSDTYYLLMGGYSEVYGSDGDAVVDLWNDGVGDASFGLRHSDDMFMIGTDYQLTSNAGLNMNMSHEFGFGGLPQTGYKVFFGGKTKFNDILEYNNYFDYSGSTDAVFRNKGTDGFKFQYNNGGSYIDLLDLSTAGADFQTYDIRTTGDITGGNLSGTNTGDQDLSGYVVGAASSTDNAFARFDGTTGKIIQNSSVTADDSGNLTTAGNATVGGTSTGQSIFHEGMVINEDGGGTSDDDFRVETGNVSNALFLDASDDVFDINVDTELASTKAFYFGDKDTDGSWRIVRSGDDLDFQRRVSGSWVSKSTITG